MADTYKGLTIKIGGDTTQLVQALKASETAISRTQKQLQTLEKAARLDGTNLGVIGKKFEVMADEASAATRRFQTLRKALNEVSTGSLSNSAIKQLAADTTEATYKAEKAREAYAQVVDEIKQLKNQVAQPMQMQLAEELKQAEQRLAALNTQMRTLKTSEGFSRSSTEFKELNNQIKQASQRVSELRAAVKSDPFSGLETSSEAVIAKMKELGATEKQIAQYTQLVDQYFDALENRNTAKVVAEYKDLEVEVRAAEAQAKSLYQQMAQMAATNPTATQTQEFRVLAERINQTDTVAEQLAIRLQKINSAYQLEPTNIDIAKAKFQAMANEVSTSETKIKTLREQLQLLDSQGAKNVVADTKNLALEMEKAKARLVQLNTELDQLRADASFDAQSADAQRLASEVKVAEERVEQLALGLKRVGTTDEISVLSAKVGALKTQLSSAAQPMTSLTGTMQQLGWSMYATIMPAIQQFASYAITAADEVDSSYRDMRKTVQGTEEQFESLKEAALEYSQTHYTSADTILDIEALGGQLGVATDKLEAFATTVSNLDIATDLDAETAATQLGQLQGIMNDMTQDDFARYGDALTRLGNNNATLESKISNVMLRIASTGTIVGMTTPQLLAWSTAVAATGQGAESAGTAISKTMSNIESAVGAGGESLNNFASVAGMSASEFADAWNNSPSDAMYAFIQGLKNIEASGGSADNTLVSLGITSVRQKQAILGLMQTIDGLNSNIQMSQDAWDGVSDSWGAAGDAAREADRKAEGFSGSIQMLQNSFQVFASTAGESLVPLINGLTSLMQGVTEVYKALPEGAKQFINFGTSVAFGFSGALIAVSALARGISTINKTIRQNTTWKAARAAVTGYASSVTAAATAETKETAAKIANNTATAQGTAAKVADATASKSAAAAEAGLTAATTASSAAFTVLKGAIVSTGIGALVIALGYAVSSFADFISKAQETRASIDGVGEALEAAEADYTIAEEAADSYTKTISDIKSEHDSLTQSLSELNTSSKETWQELGTNSALVDNYLATIRELSGGYDEYGNAATLSADKQAKLKAAVDGLNSTCGTNIEIIDAATGTLNTNVAAIERNTEAWKKNARAQAAQEMLIDYQKQAIELDSTIKDLNKTIEDNGGSWNTMNDDVVDANFALDEAQQQVSEVNNMIDYLTQEYAENATAAEGMATSTDGVTTELSEEEEALQSTIESIGELAATYPTMLEAFGFGVTGASEFATTLTNAGLSVDEISSKIQSYADQANDAFNRIEAGSELSTAQMLANMQYNASLTETWANNIKTLYAMAGSDSARDFVANLATLGPSYNAQIEEIIAGGQPYLQQFGDQWAAGAKAGVDAASSEFATSSPELAAAMQLGLSGASGSVQEGGAELGSSASQGLESKTGEAQQAGTDVGESGANALNAQQNTYHEEGAANGSNYAVGLWSKTGEASSAAAAVASAAAANLEHSIAKEGPLHNGGKGEKPWGAHAIQNYLKGMESQIPEIEATMAKIMSVTASYMKYQGGLDYVGGRGTIKSDPQTVTVRVEQDQARSFGNQPTININGAVLNDDAAMQTAALNFMNELSRMNRLNKAGA